MHLRFAVTLGVFSTALSRLSRRNIAAGAGPYMLAVGLSLIAGAIRLALLPVLARRLPFGTFYASVMFAAWLGRWRAGALATVLGAVGGFLVAPPHLAISDVFLGNSEVNGMVLFLLIGAMSTVLIEAHHRAVEALGISNERLHQALEAARMLAWTWRGDALTVESGNVADILGLPTATPEAWRGDFFRHIHPDDRAAHEALVARAAARGGTYASEFRFVRPDTGATIWLQGNAHVFLNKAGEVEFVRGVVTDVTERKRSQEAVRLSERRLTLALEAAEMGTWDWDLVADQLTCSPEYETLCGYAPGQGRRNYRDFLARIHPDDRTAVERAVEQARAQCSDYRDEYRIVRPDGTIHWIAACGRFYADQAGQATRMLGVVSDITRHKELEQELQESARRKDEFLAMLSHELRNPLAPIRNAAELLRLLSPERPELTQARVIIERQVTHMSRLVDDLLDVARITKGKISLQNQRVDLGDVIRQAVETVRPALQQRRHDLSLALPREPLPLVGDPARLIQVFANLLSNAATFTPSGGRISIAAELCNGQALVRVRDTGMGIDPKVLPFIFDLFVQQPAALDRQHGGLGIGLSVVKRLVELHGGSVGAESAGPGAGSEFRVTLPLARALAEPIAMPAAVPREHQGVAAPLRVLIVEDNPDAADSLAMLLQLQGHTVCIARDGLVALRSAEEFAADVAFIDIGLPGIDGYEVARRLRRMGSFRRAILVAMSGYGQAEDKQQAKEAGFDQHLTKPVAPEAIEAVIERAAA